MENNVIKSLNEFFGVSLCSDYVGTPKFPQVKGAVNYFVNEEHGMPWLWILTATGMVGYALENGTLKCYVSKSIHPVKIKTRYPETELTEIEQEHLDFMKRSGKGVMVRSKKQAEQDIN